VVVVALLSIINVQPPTVFAQGTAFTYQGRLNDGVAPANGIYDLRFAIYDSTTLIAGPSTNSGASISNGLFTVALDFGNVFSGAPRFLEIGVRTNGGGGFVILSPRQPLTPAPYAITAANVVSGGLAGGTYTNPVTFNNAANGFTGSFSGNGTSVSNVNAVSLNGLAATNFWNTHGNTGTAAGLNFIGTTDNQPLEFRVNGDRVLRLEPGSTGMPNVIGGSSLNYVSNGVVGATISGGGAVSFNDVVLTNSVSGDFGTIGGGYNNSESGQGGTISGGGNNSASMFATISGGVNNHAIAYASTIGGGFANNATNNVATIAGGFGNTAAGSAAIGGGDQNVASGEDSTIAGGFENEAAGLEAAVGGGAQNHATGDGAYIGGGGQSLVHQEGNRASGLSSAILGGDANMVTNQFASIGGGLGNTNFGFAAVIGGGDANRVTNDFGSIGGGYGNTNFGYAAVIGGGYGNTNIGYEAVIGGGYQNRATNSYATLGGGYGNVAGGSAGYSTVAGGYQNTASGSYATVGAGSGNSAGGNFTTVAGGLANNATGTGATVPGGIGNSATAPSTFAAGTDALAQHDGAFVWGDDSTGLTIASIANNSVTMRAAGGYRLFSNSGATLGVSLAANGTSWSTISDRNAKKNFAPIDEDSILQKLAAVPIEQWNYKSENDSDTPNIGPMAQEFKAAFYPGRDDKTISTLEFDGVELAAIQGLNRKLTERLEQKETEITELKRAVAELKRRDDEQAVLKRRLEVLETIVLKSKTELNP
jgi:hypothetical protein